MAVWENLSIRGTIDDLRKAMSGFHWVVLRSAHLDGFCECIKEVERQYSKATSNCRRCLGSGRLFTDFLIKGIQYIPTPQFRSDESQKGPGVLHNEGFRYLISVKDRIPKETDFLIEIDLDKDTGNPVTPISVVTVYDITNVRVLWGDKGREEFYSVTTKARQIAPGTFKKDKSDY